MLLDSNQHEVLARGAEPHGGLYRLAYTAAVPELYEQDHVIWAP